jgi:hypothetical protein
MPACRFFDCNGQLPSLPGGPMINNQLGGGINYTTIVAIVRTMSRRDDGLFVRGGGNKRLQQEKTTPIYNQQGGSKGRHTLDAAGRGGAIR